MGKLNDLLLLIIRQKQYNYIVTSLNYTHMAVMYAVCLCKTSLIALDAY